MDTVTIIAVIVAIVALAVAAWALYEVRTTRHLKAKFGPEYDYLVQREGDRRRAERELSQREARVKKLHIRNLTPDERERYSDSWRKTQARFVDDPGGAISEADVLVSEVMKARGYPTTAEVSVDHAEVMGKYREAHHLAERNRRGEAGTEDLRRAMICYRALFEELLGSKVTEFPQEHEEVRR